MSTYLLVGSEDPFDGGGRRVYELAGALADHGERVAVYLVQNGVLGCRHESTVAADLSVLAKRVNTMADDFSLRERGISETEVVAGVRVAGIEEFVAAAMADGSKVLWT